MQTISPQMFERLPSINFTWSILKYLDSNKPVDTAKIKKVL